MKNFWRKWSRYLWSVLGLIFTVVSATRSEWVAAGIFSGLTVYCFLDAYADVWSSRRRKVEVNLSDAPNEAQVKESVAKLRKTLATGAAPVETPSDTPKLTWADHARNCDICREREL